MKLAKLETLRLAEFPNLLWLRLHTDCTGPLRAAARALEAARRARAG